MTRYYITHTDEQGEEHQIRGTWEANYPDVAITRMLIEAGAKDDGKYEAHEVLSEDDVV